ncbi:hypothetical protein WM91_18770 [Klebsiella pneumoniae]|nr:hypothetical protein WM91_18770 [Klebsiella pneumoniae]
MIIYPARHTIIMDLNRLILWFVPTEWGGLPGSVEDIHQYQLIILLYGNLKVMRMRKYLKRGIETF